MTTFDLAHIVVATGILYEVVLGDDDTSTKAFHCFEQNVTAPAGTQGVVSAIYGIQQYRQTLGQPPNQWTDRVFGFTGNILNRNVPILVELGLAMFHLVANGAGMQIYTTPETMNLILATDPTIEAVDVPIPTTPGGEAAQCWHLYPIPSLYIAPFLTRSLSMREAFTTVFQTAMSLGQVDTI
jgi:hypothetical protein